MKRRFTTRVFQQAFGFFILISSPLFASIQFQPPRGVYEEAVDLRLISSSTSGVIVYSIDPYEDFNPSTAQTYKGPIRIDRSSVIRAAVLNSDGSLGSVSTHSYIFPSQIFSETVEQNDLTKKPVPDSTEVTLKQNFEDLESSSHHYPKLRDRALGSFKNMAVVSLLSQEMTIGDPLPSSVEIFDPLKKEGEHFDIASSVQADCGAQIFGGSSRYLFPKKSFRLYFREEFGPKSLDFPIFEKQGSVRPAEKFDQILLRSFSQDSYAYFTSWTINAEGEGEFIDVRDKGPFVWGLYAREYFSQQSFFDMGHVAPHSRPAHLFINGRYWGLYQLLERPTKSFAASYFGGDKENYIALRGGCENHEDPDCEQGFEAGKGARFGVSSIGDEELVGLELWRKLYDERLDIFKSSRSIDLDNFIDYILLNQYGGNTDLSTARNWYAVGRKNADRIKLRFVPWDNDFTLRNHTYDISRFYDANPGIRPFGGGPGYIFPDLLAKDPDFMMAVMERAHELFGEKGLLGPEKSRVRFVNGFDRVRDAISLDVARWWDLNEETASRWVDSLALFFDKPSEAINASDRYQLVFEELQYQVGENGYIAKRSDLLLKQIHRNWSQHFDGNLDPYPGLKSFPRQEVPVIARNVEGSDHRGKEVEMFLSIFGGDLYYTLNGEDPRLPGGEINPRAVLYKKGELIDSSSYLHIKARSLQKTQGVNRWSTLAERRLHDASELQPASWSNLMITKLHYNPSTNEDREFVELANQSGSPVELKGIRFSEGIEFEVDQELVLAPYERVIFARNPSVYRERQGEWPRRFLEARDRILAQSFDKKLSNGGEKISLLAADGSPIFEFTYDDRAAWPPLADGGGFCAGLREEVLLSTPRSLGNKNAALENGANWEPLYKIQSHQRSLEFPEPAIEVKAVAGGAVEFLTGFDRAHFELQQSAVEDSYDLQNWNKTDVDNFKMIDYDASNYYFSATTKKKSNNRFFRIVNSQAD